VFVILANSTEHSLKNCEMFRKAVEGILEILLANIRKSYANGILKV